MDIQKSIFGYPLIDFRISINVFLDIIKCIFGYPKIMLNFGYPLFDYYWISLNRFMDILKSALFKDILR